MKKRIVSIMLASTMLLTAMASATFNDVTSISTSNIKAVGTLTQYGIVQGDNNGKFNPTSSVTRGEMAKMIAVMLNKGEPSSATTTFADTKGHWAEKYVAYCVSKGIIAGRNTTTFAPNDTVTGTEAAKMLLIALGMDATTGGLTGANWDTNTQKYASTFGLTSSVSSSISSTLNRQNSAQMIANTLSAKKATLSGSNYSASGTVLSTSLGYSAFNTVQFMYDTISSMGYMKMLSNETSMLNDAYGISSADYDSAVFGMCPMSPGIDELTIVKVKSGKLSAVKTALETRKTYLIDQKAFYGDDIEVAKTTQVITSGDYAMLLTASGYAEGGTAMINIFKALAN